MNNNKVHLQGKVPLSWENKPGVSKVTPKHTHNDVAHYTTKPLSPPPNAKANSLHNLQLPLPPCKFQPPRMSSSSKNKKTDDPFLIAFKECTKNNTRDKLMAATHNHQDDHGSGFGLKKNILFFSCKHPGNVMDASIVKVAKLPTSKSQREKKEKSYSS